MNDEHRRTPQDEQAVKTSRRGFLAHLAGAALAASGALAVLPAGNASVRRLNAMPQPVGSAPSEKSFPAHGGKGALDHFHYETFLPHLNSRFRIREAATELELIGVTVSKYNNPSKGIEQFRLTFRGPGALSLEENTYTLAQAHLGEFPLFILPTGHDKQGRYYQAVFTRIPRTA